MSEQILRRGLSPESQELVELIREWLLELKAQRELDRRAPFATGVQRLTAMTGIWALRAKLQSDRQASEGDRITRLEEKVDHLYGELDEERRRLRTAETLTHRFRLGLITAVNQL